MNIRTLSACCALILLPVLAGCSRSPEARRKAHLTKGAEFVDKKDYSRAILEFRNAVRLNPNDADSYYQLGVAHAGAKDVRMALAAFKKATEINPKHVQSQLKLAQLYALTDDQNMLRDANDRLKTLLKESADKETLNTLAFTELKLGSTQTAVELLERALAESPAELTSSILLAQAKRSQNDLKGAEAVLLKACEAAPASADAQRNLAEFYIALRRLPEAEARLRRALELAPNNDEALMDLARLQLTLGDKASAEQNFKRLAASSGYRSIYGVFLFETGRREEAIGHFEKAFAAEPNDRAIRTQLVTAYLALNRPADAKKVLEQALSKNARDSDALLQRAEIYLKEKDFAKAESDVNAVLKLVPTSGEVHYLLAKVYQASGRTPIYRQEMAKALELNPALLPVRLELAQALLVTKEGRAALDVLAEAPEAQRTSTPWLSQRNWALWAMGDMTEMRKGIDNGLSRERSMEFLIQDGLWKLRANNAKGARASLEEALKSNPADLRALEALRQTYLAEKNAPMALQKVKEYAAQQPKAAAVQDFLGMLLMASGDTKQARTAFTVAKEVDPSLIYTDLSLVQLDAAEGKIDDARKKLVGLLASNSGNITARRWLGNIEVMRGDTNGAIEHFQQVVAADPNDAQASNNLAYLLAEHRNDNDTALKFAQKAVELNPTTPEFCDTLGWILYRKGVYGTAVKYLEQADSKSENAIWKYHLAMAYAKAGDTQRGRLTLNAALKVNPNVPEAKAAMALLNGTNP
jgi:tetratricopeptide (TPR) repeat protein